MLFVEERRILGGKALCETIEMRILLGSIFLQTCEYTLRKSGHAVDSHIQSTVLATEETTVTQQVSHRPIKC